MKTPSLLSTLNYKWITSMMLLVVISLISVSFTFKKAVTIWNQLGISEDTGLENIRRSFLEGYLYTYGASAAKKVATGNRVALAHELLNYSKQYVNGSAFRKEYAQARTRNTPVKPSDPKTKEQIQLERIASLKNSIEEGEKSMKTLPADLIAPFKEVQEMLKEQIKDYEDAEGPMVSMLVDAEQFTYKNAMKQYETSMREWANDYPEDPMVMVKTRLEKFLSVTADVDFSATVKEEYRLKKFVNKAYEQKPAEWKMAYRSGKPVVDAAREFAKQWLEELK